MKKTGFLLLGVALLFGISPRDSLRECAAQAPEKGRSSVDGADIPRASASEVYYKYKQGKAILIHSGGQPYENVHIMGAINVPPEVVLKKGGRLPALPRSKQEIFVYCY